MSNSKVIGLFDSGIGGTSIWKEVNHLLPKENYIYLADSKNAPYGEKSKDEIIYLSIKNTELLLNNNAKLIIVACNTATTNAIKVLREKFDIPFVGIEPAIKPAALHSKTHTIGVLATKGTINSELFHNNVANHPDVNIIEQIGYGLVPLIEQGKLNSDEIKSLLESYLLPMLDKNIDYLVLGCTHYPYLIPLIKKIIPKTVTIIDSSEAVARQTKKILEQNQLINTSNKKGKTLFYTNSNTKVLQEILNHKHLVKFLDF